MQKSVRTNRKIEKLKKELSRLNDDASKVFDDICDAYKRLVYKCPRCDGRTAYGKCYYIRYMYWGDEMYNEGWREGLRESGVWCPKCSRVFRCLGDDNDQNRDLLENLAFKGVVEHRADLCFSKSDSEKVNAVIRSREGS